MRSVCSSSLVLVALFLIPLQPASASKRPAAAKAVPKHPAVAASQECGDCHGEEFSEWQSSKHGQAMVKCLVCHGAIESDFIPKPASARCIACHGENVRHLNDRPPTKGKSCFACHSPHLLNPHSHEKGGR